MFIIVKKLKATAIDSKILQVFLLQDLDLDLKLKKAVIETMQAIASIKIDINSM